MNNNNKNNNHELRITSVLGTKLIAHFLIVFFK